MHPDEDKGAKRPRQPCLPHSPTAPSTHIPAQHRVLTPFCSPASQNTCSDAVLRATNSLGATAALGVSTLQHLVAHLLLRQSQLRGPR